MHVHIENASAYVRRINYENTKSQIPLGPLSGADLE